jgi:hypothetical protein
MAAEAALAADQPDKALAHLQPALDIRRDSLEPNDPALLETLRLAADIHQQAGNRQAETAHRQEEIDQLTAVENAPDPDGVASAIRLLVIYREEGETERSKSLTQVIEEWLEAGGDEVDELRERLGRVTTSATQSQ